MQITSFGIFYKKFRISKILYVYKSFEVLSVQERWKKRSKLKYNKDMSKNSRM